jgi:hypothetical protein
VLGIKIKPVCEEALGPTDFLPTTDINTLLGKCMGLNEVSPFTLRPGARSFPFACLFCLVVVLFV